MEIDLNYSKSICTERNFYGNFFNENESKEEFECDGRKFLTELSDICPVSHKINS